MFDIFCASCGQVVPPDFVKVIEAGELKKEILAVRKPCDCGSRVFMIDTVKEAATCAA